MWKIHHTYQWEALRRRFNWIRDMEVVPQDPGLHAEGDVATHTKMVLEALQQLLEFKALQEQEQHILLAAALLHDVEKRSTTQAEWDKRITAKGHASKGELTARNILYLDVPTPFHIREQVCKLVRHHGLPLWALDKPDPQKAVISASLEVDTRLLATLARANVMGRICPAQDEMLFKIDLFEELCRENQCWGQARSFPDDFTRFFYLHKEEVSPDYKLFDDTKLKVVLMAGLPGSGKDMYAHYHLSDWPQISLESLRQTLKIKPSDKTGYARVLHQAKELAKAHMRRHESFVWNAPNMSKLAREQLVHLFLTYGAFVKIVYLEAPYSMLLDQIKHREEDQQVPPALMAKMLLKMEVPALAEAHQVEYVLREEGDEVTAQVNDE